MAQYAWGKLSKKNLKSLNYVKLGKKIIENIPNFKTYEEKNIHSQKIQMKKTCIKKPTLSVSDITW